MSELKTITNLVYALSKFPSVGSKTAERMAFSLLNMKKEDVDFLVRSIEEATTKIHPCKNCGLLTEDELCEVCSDEKRTHNQCIVIPNAKDYYSFESMHFNGIYHVLGGEISSYHGINPEDLRIKELLKRIKDENIKELIIATNPTIEGETTALYIARILKDEDIKISRIGFGLPVGGQLEYADSLTIQRSFDNRTDLKKEDK